MGTSTTPEDADPVSSIPTTARARVRGSQVAIGLFLIAVAGLLAAGAARFPVDKGYSILGPGVFPMAVAAFVAIVGSFLAYEGATGGYRRLTEDPRRPADEARRGRLGALWVSAGVLVIALLINKIGFVLAAALLFVCAARGFGSRRPLMDLAVGIALTLPMFWLFTAALGLSLPSLVNAWI